MKHRLLVRSALLVGTLASVACSESSVVANNPTPGITAISPTTVDQGVAGQVIVVTGSDFVSGSVVRVDGADRPTQYLSGTELRATLPGTDFAVTGTRQLVVTNPAPGGGTSNPISLGVRAPVLPLPVITSFDPAFVTAGSGAQDVTINGTGFTSQSQVLVSFSPRPTTFNSATQVKISLSSTETAAANTLDLRVSNPPPGGGVSSETHFEIRAPVPTLAALSLTQADAGELTLTVGLTGTGFLESSAVRFAGAPRPTTFINGTALEVTLGAGDLRAAGTFPITVENPGPGGGTSSALTLTLVNGIPEITVLPSAGATAGSGGFSVAVHGRRFVPGAVVRWNGADRPTTYLQADRLSVELIAADVAGPATNSITVRNPSPGGGVSSPTTMTVRALGSASATSRVLTLTAADLVYDPPSGKLYASIAASSPFNGNSVVAIDPLTGTITGTVFAGSSPGRIARSDNGQYLYVGIDGANSVRRVTIPALVAGLQWSVGAGLIAGDIEPIPGSPLSVAVSRQNPGSSPPLVGVTVYDDGVPRPNSSPGHTGGNRIAFLGDPGILYGYNNAHSGFGFYEIAINTSGASHRSETGGLIGGFYVDIVGAAGRIYGTDGSVVDAGRLVKVGTFPGQATSMAVDPLTGRAFMLIGNEVTVFDLNTYQILGNIPLPPVAFDHPARLFSALVRWGTDGLAFSDLDELFIIRSPLIGP